MSSQTAIDVDGMLTAATVINSTAGDVNEQKSGVQSTFTSLMGSWTGQTATTFAEAMQNFYNQCDKITSVLEGLSSTVQTSATNYQGTHEDNTTLAAAAVATTADAAQQTLPNFS